ncbi:MAG: DNA-packaging protein [Sphingomonas sp.]|uniref:DNA-packaging protein n=1 Tax=Sphingomonas sp. TaxID=28214 RepID=UPI0025CFD442|nr:terminase family protein [Sphingomonas sp.]MBX3563101.1 DNA-packaging protein [Sphingomonas sp.]
MSGAQAQADALIDQLLALPEDERLEAVRAMSAPQRREFAARWRAWAHGGQRMPPGDWRVWLIRAGRGFGKTRAGAEWVCEVARSIAGARIALVGANADDVRQVMIEGPSGLVDVARADERPVWHRASRELHWPNGTIASVYSAEAPERLRGPEHEAAWCDELGKWRNADATWDNLVMTMRRGERPRIVVTTTPRSTRLIHRIRALPSMIETTGRTRDNPHLPASFVAAMVEEYGGTLKGRQELEGELIEEVAGALWSRALIEARRVRTAPALVRVVVGVDPPAGVGGDACGIVAVGLGADGRGYVLEDASVSGQAPEGWARAVAACAARRGADRVIAEKNQGGSMVESVLRAADAVLPVRLVHASRGKSARAEPVSALYESGKVWHAGAFPALEDELRGLQAGGGYEGPGRSPDRADALVWALSELMLRKRGRPAVRGI